MLHSKTCYLLGYQNAGSLDIFVLVHFSLILDILTIKTKIFVSYSYFLIRRH